MDDHPANAMASGSVATAERVTEAVACQIRAGHRPAFECLVGEMESRLRHHATSIIRDHIAAQDVVQDTFLAVWQQRKSLPDTDGRLRAYIFGIIHNLACRHLRRTKLRHSRESEASERQESDRVSADPADAVLAGEAWDAVMDLPENIREVLVLRCGMGLTAEEVASTLQVPLGTVKTRQRTAVRELRKRFGVPGSGRTTASGSPPHGPSPEHRLDPTEPR